uniref:Agamous-like MADS-box protein AGL62 n=2 Tax=Cajanus cajan TaxID=3821 RepID=A0A151RCQ7_CAJCA|nr:Agamous-like MADS-box protein AGL62 [Cajanus cajan]
MNVVVKKTKGRQKIEMKKISNERNLHVTFSKRRNGIFKKASELATLCGVDLAVIVFSPGQRVFSFGTPSVDSVIQRYTGQAPPPLLNLDLNEAHLTVDERELHAHLGYLSNQITIEKKRDEELNHLLKTAKNNFWWATPIERMDKTQLEKFKTALLDLKTHINLKKQKLLNESTYISPHIFAGGSSSSNVNNNATVLPQPLLRNLVIDGSITSHQQFNKNLDGHEHGPGPTFRFF